MKIKWIKKKWMLNLIIICNINMLILIWIIKTLNEEVNNNIMIMK